MKINWLFPLIIFLFPIAVAGQNVPAQKPGKVAPNDTIAPNKGNREQQIQKIEDEKVKHLSDSLGNEPLNSRLIDTTVQNKYGDLLDDDTVYNTRKPLWIPALEVIGSDVFIWSVNRYIMNETYARIGPETWKRNIREGWEWDADRFGINFIGHPYSGTMFFNAGRSNGYNYFESFSMAVGGSLMWEYLFEDTRPSYNDIIATPVNGAFLGEILYRLSSNILDDRTRGFQRFSREFCAAAVNPVRGLNRLIMGQCFRRTNKEIYEKEPLNVSIFSGVHQINDGTDAIVVKGSTSFMINLQLDYGNPFENRSRKPFDFFKLRTEFDFGVGRKILSNITGYGILAGRNKSYGRHSALFGIFQYADYWDNKTFELGAVAFGGGGFSRLRLKKTWDLYTNVHAAVIPLAGNSTHFGPDESELRDYNFGGGLAGKLESTLNFDRYATVSMMYYYYMIRTYVGAPGDNFISILRPRVTVAIYKQLSMGFEQFIYINDRNLRGHHAIHSVRTEQKLFLLLYLEDNQRRGRYN